MTDLNGYTFKPGDRVAYQIHPLRPWRKGTVLADGRSVRSDYNGKTVVPWSGFVRLCPVS